MSYDLTRLDNITTADLDPAVANLRDPVTIDQRINDLLATDSSLAYRLADSRLADSRLADRLAASSLADNLADSSLADSLAKSLANSSLADGVASSLAASRSLASRLANSSLASRLADSRSLSNSLADSRLTNSLLADSLADSRLADSLAHSRLADSLADSRLANSFAAYRLADSGLADSGLASGLAGSRIAARVGQGQAAMAVVLSYRLASTLAAALLLVVVAAEICFVPDDDGGGSGVPSDVVMSAVFDIAPAGEVSEDAAEVLLRRTESLFGTAQHLVEHGTDIPDDIRDGIESDLQNFRSAYERPGGPLPVILRGYETTIAAFVAKYSGASEALQNSNDPVAAAAGNLVDAIADAAEDPETSGAAVADALAELVKHSPDVDPADANDTTAQILGWRDNLAAVGVAAAGAGALGTFVINIVAGLGLGPLTVVLSGLFIATFSALSILYTARKRTNQ